MNPIVKAFITSMDLGATYVGVALKYLVLLGIHYLKIF